MKPWMGMIILTFALAFILVGFGVGRFTAPREPQTKPAVATLEDRVRHTCPKGDTRDWWGETQEPLIEILKHGYRVTCPATVVEIR